MKPLQINLSKMKKVAGDKNSSTFLHDSGHKMIIAHSPLPALQRKQLEKLPIHEEPKKMHAGGNLGAPEIKKYAEGTPDAPVGDDKAFDPWSGESYTPLNTQQLAQLNSDIPSSEAAAWGGDKLPQSPTEKSESEIEVPVSGAQQAAPQEMPKESPAQVTSSPSNSMPANVNAAVAQGAQGIKEQQDVSAKLAAQQAKIEHDDISAKQDLQNNLVDNRSIFDRHRQELMDLYKSQDIKPNHYLENMSIPSKVSTAIGLMLGGLGSAYTHQANPAAQWLEGQINRDLEAQKARQDQTKTLLGENQKYFDDQQLGYNAARIAQNDIYTHQIQEAAAKMGTAQAKANADQLTSKLALDTSGLMNQSAVRKTVMDSIAKNGGQGLTAHDLQYAGFMNPEQAEKEQASIDRQKNAIQGVNSLFDKMDKEQTAGNFLNPQSHQRMKQYTADLISTIQAANPGNKLSEEFIQKKIEPLVTGTFESGKTRGSGRQTVLNMVREGAEPTPIMSQYAKAALPNYQGRPPQPEHVIQNGHVYTMNYATGKYEK